MMRGNPNKLYRNVEAGRIAGVCAGLADYFGVSVTVIRICTVVAVLMGAQLFIVAYGVLWLVLDPRPELMYESDNEERFWKRYRRSPDDFSTTLRERMEGINRRIAKIEAAVTSPRYSLRREIDNLK